MRRALLPRAAGTAALAAATALRAYRALGSAENIRRFYLGDGGFLWAQAGLALFFGPYLTAAFTAAALWLPRERAMAWARLNLCAAAFFVLEEGLIAFARTVNGHGGYVGAEPLLSALAGGISIITLLRARGAGRRNK